MNTLGQEKPSEEIDAIPDTRTGKTTNQTAEETMKPIKKLSRNVEDMVEK